MSQESDLCQMERWTYAATYISNNEAFRKYVRTNKVILYSPVHFGFFSQVPQTSSVHYKYVLPYISNPTCLHSHEHPFEAPTN